MARWRNMSRGHQYGGA